MIGCGNGNNPTMVVESKYARILVSSSALLLTIDFTCGTIAFKNRTIVINGNCFCHDSTHALVGTNLGMICSESCCCTLTSGSGNYPGCEGWSIGWDGSSFSDWSFCLSSS